MSHLDLDGGSDPWKEFCRQMVAENAPFTRNFFHNNGHWVARVKAARQLEAQAHGEVPVWEERDGVGADPENALRHALRGWGIRSVDVPGVPVSAPVGGGGYQPAPVASGGPPPNAGGDIAICREIKSGARQPENGCLWPGAKPKRIDDGSGWFDEPVKRWLIGNKPVPDAPPHLATTPAKAITWRAYAETPALRWKLDSFTTDAWYCVDLDDPRTQQMKATPDQLVSGYKHFLAKALAAQAYADTFAPPQTAPGDEIEEDVPF